MARIVRTPRKIISVALAAFFFLALDAFCQTDGSNLLINDFGLENSEYQRVQVAIEDFGEDLVEVGLLSDLIRARVRHRDTRRP